MIAASEPSTLLKVFAVLGLGIAWTVTFFVSALFLHGPSVTNDQFFEAFAGNGLIVGMFPLTIMWLYSIVALDREAQTLSIVYGLFLVPIASIASWLIFGIADFENSEYGKVAPFIGSACAQVLMSIPWIKFLLAEPVPSNNGLQAMSLP